MTAHTDGAEKAPLTAQTLLGENAVAALAALTAHLRRTTGLDLRFDGDGGAPTSDDAAAWRHDLVWACGLLAMRTLRAADTSGEIVAAPVFAGERTAHYHSVIVARPDGPVRTVADVARCRVAINERASWSGCHALLAHFSAAGHRADFAAVTTSGAHRRSVEAVADGRSDAAAIDGTIWEWLTRTEPALTDRLAVIGRTVDWPAPPFVLSGALERPLRERLTAGLLAVRAGDVPGLERIEACDATRYRTMLARADEQEALVRELRP